MKVGKLYFSAFTAKTRDKLQHICNITSLEFLCLDHFGVAMRNLSDDPSRKICKRRDSQRCGDPSKQRFWTRDYKKCPCGEKKKRKLKSKERKGIKNITGKFFYLGDSCAETAGVDHITPKLTIRVQIWSMSLSSRCVTLN